MMAEAAAACDVGPERSQDPQFSTLDHSAFGLQLPGRQNRKPFTRVGRAVEREGNGNADPPSKLRRSPPRRRATASSTASRALGLPSADRQPHAEGDHQGGVPPPKAGPSPERATAATCSAAADLGSDKLA